MRLVVVISIAAAAACAPRVESFPPRHLSAMEHHDEAVRHEQLAADNVKLAEAARAETKGDQRIHCLDRPLEGVTYSGGEPIEVLRPCWTSVTSPSEHFAEQAREHREAAAWHRQQARALWETERIACAGLGEDEVATSPFTHTEDIARVDELRQDGRLRGARVLFKKVPGLTAQWMHRAIHCHYARSAALGFPSSYMPLCPATLPDVQIAVAEEADGIAVTIRSERDDTAAAAYGRATDLVAER